MYERILVPLDGSALSEAILPFVERIAGPLDSEVMLLTVANLNVVDGYLVIETVPGKTRRVISGELRLLDHP